MGGSIFINYRRGDDPGNTGRLFDRLQEAFQHDRLFMDVDRIEPGLDFVRVLEEQVAQCDVVLAVIGNGWIDARDETGARRLDNPADFVLIEIASALRQHGVTGRGDHAPDAAGRVVVRFVLPARYTAHELPPIEPSDIFTLSSVPVAARTADISPIRRAKPGNLFAFAGRPRGCRQAIRYR
jgi:hypothetical protein